MTEFVIQSAESKHMGQINLVNIQADLGTFGLEYPSFTFSYEDLTKAVEQKNVLVVLKETLVVAFIKFMFDSDNAYCYLHQISVVPDVQRQGLAKKLIASMVEKAQGQNLKRVGLTTAKSTPWGKTLYTKLGFEEILTLNAPLNWHEHIKIEMMPSPKDKIYMELRI